MLLLHSLGMTNTRRITRNYRSRNILTATALSAALALTACGAEAAQGQSTEGGTLTYLEYQSFNSLYPPAAGYYPNGALLNNITDRLLWQDPETLELHPWIAAELPEVNDNATEFTFTIRDDVTYSDGSQLTAENVVKNLDLYGQGDEARTLTISEAINNYDFGEVIDDNTVRFHFSEPSPGFAQAVSTINSGLVSDETLDRSEEEFGPGNATEIIGSGPFVVAAEQLDTEYTLEARQDYSWAPEGQDHQGAALVDEINVVVTPEDSVRVGALASGQADIARQIPASDEEQVTEAGLEIVHADTGGVTNAFNLRKDHPLLEDIEVRQAIIHAIDREAILESLFTERYPLATSSLSTGALGYADQSEYYEYDPESAQDLLDDAGWEEGSEGIREKDGEKLSLVVNHASPLPRSEELVVQAAQQLREVGIELTMLPGDDWATQNAASRELDNVQIYHQMVGRADYEVLKSQYHSDDRDALLNTDEELDRLLDEIAVQPSDEAREAAAIAAQEYLSEQALVLPFFEEPLVYGMQDHVEGFQTESVGRPWFYEVSLHD